MSNITFELDVFATEMRMPTLTDGEGVMDMEILVESLMQLRLKLRFLHLVQCEHFRQLEAGVPARRFSTQGEVCRGCHARRSIFFD